MSVCQDATKDDFQNEVISTNLKKGPNHLICAIHINFTANMSLATADI